MSEDSDGIVGLFNKLCELSFTNEARKEINIYRRTRYTGRHCRILKRCAYETLFEYLNGPWVGEKKRIKDSSNFQYNAGGLSVRDEISIAAFKLRLARRFDDAQRLEENVSRWEKSQKRLKEDVAEETNCVGNDETVLRFLVALSGTGTAEPQPLIGHHDNNWMLDSGKHTKPLLPEGPLLITDSCKMRHSSLESGCYVHYPRELFENPPVLAIPGNGNGKETQTGVEIFEALPGSLGSFFDLQGASENEFEKDTRMSLFSALVHSQTTDIQVNLGLPELPSSPNSRLRFSLKPKEMAKMRLLVIWIDQRSLVLSAKESKSAESLEDEGFHELTGSVTSSSLSSLHKAAEEDIWTLAAKLPPQKFYTWEMGGRRDHAPEKPYLTEAGPLVFDELYDILMKQVSYLVNDPTPEYQMMTLKELVKDSLNVLLGVPSASFDLDKPTQSVRVNGTVRMSGCSPETLRSTLTKLADIGTDYMRVNKFANHHNPAGGLVLQAFRGALLNLLHCYRAVVLSVDANNVQSPFQLCTFFHDLAKQMRFLAEVCICSEAFKKSPSDRKPRFPTGVKLLTYLYELCLEHSSSKFYSVLLSLLKNSAAPYILFIQNWIFKGVCHDLYGEFMIEMDDQYLAYRDKHYWTNGFVMTDTDKLKCVPMFLGELANDIFICGKSINLLRLCSPEHYLCDPGIPIPRMEVTFSMKELQSILTRCQEYSTEMETLARKEKKKRQAKERALEEAKQHQILEEKEKAEKALKHIKELIKKAKDAMQKKKREDFLMLKEQMEQALKDRVLAKEREDEEDASIMRAYRDREVTTATLEDEAKEKAREELIKYYEELKREVVRREQHALWTIQRHRLDTVRMQFLAQEEAKLQKMKDDVFQPRVINTPVSVETKLVSSVQRGSSGAAPPTTPVSGPNPGIVSLIASGVKTEALVRFQTEKGRSESDQSFADSGVDFRSITESVSQRELADETMQFTASTNYDDDDTDVSSVEPSSLAEGGTSHEQKTKHRKEWSRSSEGNAGVSLVGSEADRQRKTWGSTTEEEWRLAEQENKERKMWEDPPEGGVTFAESAFPRGHPSESSIQHVLYAPGKRSEDDVDGQDSKPLQGHSSDSTAQDIIYGGGSQEESKYARTPVHGHPSDSAAQNMIYGHGDTPKGTHSAAQEVLCGEGASNREIKSPLHGHPSDDALGAVMYPRSDAHSRSHTLTPRLVSGHPSDSQVDGLLYPRDTANDTPTQSRSTFGHPSDAQVQLYSDVTPDSRDMALAMSHKSRSSWGHPSEGSVQKLLGDISTLQESQQATRGTPPLSTVHHLLYPQQQEELQYLSSRGNSLPSSVQDILYPSKGGGSRFLSLRGTPPPSIAQDLLYPKEKSPAEQVKSSRGHEPAVRIKRMMYPEVKGKEERKEVKLKPLEFEDIWVASRVEPLMDNFDILDEEPIGNLLERVIHTTAPDTVDEDTDAANLLSLPILLQRSVTAPLLSQISLVNSAIVNYFMEELGLQKQFEVFRKVMFMEDGEFALSLSEQLFEKVSSGLSPRELCTPTVLNNTISRALQMSVYADTTEHAQQLSFALKWIPDMFKMNDLEMFDFLELRNRVQWPVNIVITENSIIKYNKLQNDEISTSLDMFRHNNFACGLCLSIVALTATMCLYNVFSFMLRIKRISWVLREIWFHLKHIGYSRKSAGSPQLRQLQLFRHELQHFVDNIQGYLSNQILNVSWAEFQHELEHNVQNLDDLHHRHTDYLNKAIFRSLLNKKASPVMKIISDIFSLVLKLHTQLMSAPWQQHQQTGHVTHPAYGIMCSTMKSFKDCSRFLFTVVSKLVKRGYQSHLEDFLLRINFNDYYKTA